MFELLTLSQCWSQFERHHRSIRRDRDSSEVRDDSTELQGQNNQINQFTPSQITPIFLRLGFTGQKKDDCDESVPGAKNPLSSQFSIDQASELAKVIGEILNETHSSRAVLNDKNPTEDCPIEDIDKVEFTLKKPDFYEIKVKEQKAKAFLTESFLNLNAYRFLRCKRGHFRKLKPSLYSLEKVQSWLVSAQTIHNNREKSRRMEVAVIDGFQYDDNNTGAVQLFTTDDEINTRPDGIHFGKKPELENEDLDELKLIDLAENKTNDVIHLLEHKHLENTDSVLYLTEQIKAQLEMAEKHQGSLRIVITSNFDPEDVDMVSWPRPSWPLGNTKAKIYLVNKFERQLPLGLAPLYRWNKLTDVWEKVEEKKEDKKKE